MLKFLNILDNIVLSEQKKDVFPADLYGKLVSLSEKLWNDRNKEYKRKTLVDKISFKTKDGTDGQVKVYINPRLKFIGLMDTSPKYSRDPMDFVMDLQPKEYGSLKNLFLTIYHEMMHATDPRLSTKMSMKDMSNYSEHTDSKYWGHPIEFRAITNEFLEAMQMEFDRRITSFRSKQNLLTLQKSLNNIMDYFKTGKPLSKNSLNILKRMNDEGVLDNRISKELADIQTEFPQTSELFPKESEEPYFLTYIEQIKTHNYGIWRRFLTMLYKVAEDISKKIQGLI